MIFVVILVVPYASGVWDDYGVISFSLWIMTLLPFLGIPFLLTPSNQ